MTMDRTDSDTPYSFPADALQQLCESLFSSFDRSDQRRWGEVYVRGLVEVEGRKSVRRICEQVLGWRADQRLQQFVNQSPWDWTEVRQRLAQLLTAETRPSAWVAEEGVFPKNGQNSVGVAKQYSTSAHRTLNCQLGLVMFLSGEAGPFPVNWRLLLPRTWDADVRRRSRAHVPEDERHRSWWQHLLDMTDEMTFDWDLPALPVVVDACRQTGTERLIAGLEERGLRYLVRLDPRFPIAASPGTRPFLVGELVARVAARDRVVVGRQEQIGVGGTRAQLISLPASEDSATRIRRAHRYVVAEWGRGGRAPRAIWLTNLGSARLPELVRLTRLRRRTADSLTEMYEESGLRHFEGRSYRGWHHHTTLVSVALAHQRLSSLSEQEDQLLRASV